jgi:hypothetical protein
VRWNLVIRVDFPVFTLDNAGLLQSLPAIDPFRYVCERNTLRGKWRGRRNQPTTGKETGHPSRATKPVILRSRIDASKGKLQKLDENITGRLGQDRYLARLSGQ